MRKLLTLLFILLLGNNVYSQDKLDKYSYISYDDLIKLSKDILLSTDEYGRNILMIIAPYVKDTRSIEYLIESGIDINAKDKSGLTALIYSIDKDPKIKIIEYLLNKGIDVNAKGEMDINALSTSVSLNCSIEIIDLLIKYGAEINATVGEGITPIMIAAYNNHIEAIKRLIEKGASINYKTIYGTNILHYSLRNRNIKNEIIEYLILSGVNINEIDDQGKTPLFYAAENNNNDSIRILLAAGADFRVRDIYFKSFIDYANIEIIDPKIFEKYKFLIIGKNYFYNTYNELDRIQCTIGIKPNLWKIEIDLNLAYLNSDAIALGMIERKRKEIHQLITNFVSNRMISELMPENERVFKDYLISLINDKIFNTKLIMEIYFRQFSRNEL